MTHAGLAAAPQLHELLFYDATSELAEAVVEHLVAGLTGGESAVVIATPEHLAAIESALSAAGVDLALARDRGTFVTRDAATTLASILVNGAPHPDRFAAVMGSILEATAERTAVRAFGEMVALLWTDGKVPAAIALESLWNDLADSHQLSLLCAYPTTALGSAELAQVNQVCRLHSAVLPPPSYGAASTIWPEDGKASALEVFVAVPEAVSAARRFVKETLTAWNEHDLVPDGTLIMSELATNAIIHGGSAFRAAIERDSQVVRIAVEDVGPGLPRSRRVFQDAPGGRGVAIVEQLSHRWGCDRFDGGKVIWVELETSSPRPH